MSLIMKCRTDRALIVCGVRDRKGVFRLPIHSDELPGLEIGVDRASPINPQLMETLVTVVGHSPREYEIEQDLVLNMKFNDGSLCTAFLATHMGEPQPDHSKYPRLVDVLKAFPANQNRKELLKAFQYFSSGLRSDLKALTPSDLK